MGLTVFTRYAYDDVALLASTDVDANVWRLEVEDPGAPGWILIDPVIMCSNQNWSTPDLAMWEELRKGDPNAIRRAFPNAGQGAPVGRPLAVMWDVSDYSRWQNPRTGKGYQFRFTGPLGETFEFGYATLGGNPYTFDRGESAPTPRAATWPRRMPRRLRSQH